VSLTSLKPVPRSIQEQRVAPVVRGAVGTPRRVVRSERSGWTTPVNGSCMARCASSCCNSPLFGTRLMTAVPNWWASSEARALQCPTDQSQPTHEQQAGTRPEVTAGHRRKPSGSLLTSAIVDDQLHRPGVRSDHGPVRCRARAVAVDRPLLLDSMRWRGAVQIRVQADPHPARNPAAAHARAVPCSLVRIDSTDIAGNWASTEAINRAIVASTSKPYGSVPQGANRGPSLADIANSTKVQARIDHRRGHAQSAGSEPGLDQERSTRGGKPATGDHHGIQHCPRCRRTDSPGSATTIRRRTPPEPAAEGINASGPRQGGQIASGTHPVRLRDPRSRPPTSMTAAGQRGGHHAGPRGRGPAARATPIANTAVPTTTMTPS